MKYFILIWAGLWRKKPRTFLTMLSIIAAFLLFGVLHGVNSGFNNVVGDLNVNRLYSQNKYSIVEGMPFAYANRIATVKGVNGVSHVAYFGGFYQDRHNSVGAFAADVPMLLQLYKGGIDIPADQIDAMRTKRTGAIVARDLANKYGWKVGDTVPLNTSIYTTKDGRNDYHFEIAGIYDLRGARVGLLGEDGFFFNYAYFDETRLFGTGKVDIFVIGIEDPRRAEQVSATIDGLFTNSSSEITTQSEQALVGNSLKQLADIEFIVNAIVGAVLFTLLILAANTMMQSIRERIPEMAVLKTLGFTDGAVAVLVLAESILLCVFSAALGLALARIAFLPIGRVFGSMSFHAEVMYMGLAIAVGLAIAAGVVPALRVKYLNIVDALAGR